VCKSVIPLGGGWLDGWVRKSVSDDARMIESGSRSIIERREGARGAVYILASFNPCILPSIADVLSSAPHYRSGQ